MLKGWLMYRQTLVKIKLEKTDFIKVLAELNESLFIIM